MADSCRFCHPRRIDVRGGGSALQTDTEETTVIMNATAFRLSSTFVSAAAALLMTVGASAQAQQSQELQPASPLIRPGLLYGGIGLGLQEQTRFECEGVPVCDRPRVATKMFGGIRLTPGLAIEVNQFYLGKGKRSAGPGQPIRSDYTDSSSQQLNIENRATTIGINWEIETLREFTSHVRLGLARVKTKIEVEGPSGNQVLREDKTTPYVGLGLSMQLAKNLRFNSGWDFLRNEAGNRFHVLSMGVSFEN